MVDKIKRNIVEDDAVTQPKIAAGAVDNATLSTTLITGQSELTSVADDDVLLIYDTSADTLKKVTKARTTALEAPVFSSVSPTTSSATTGTVSFTITGTGFTAGTNARLIGNGGQRRNFNSVTRTSTTSITAVFDATLFSASETPYDIQIINGEGLSVISANQIEFNQVPVFVTASGSIGTIGDLSRTGVRLVVNANDPDSAGNDTYELQSGSLPAGLSLSTETSEGGIAVISGNATAVGSDTTSNFVIRAVDPASNTTSRSFSITVKAPVSQSFTSSGTFSVPTGIQAADVLVVAGGGGGALGATGSPGGGGGAGGGGGLIFFPSYPVTPGGTITVTVGCGGSANNSAGNSAQSSHKGQDSSFGSPGNPGLGQGGVLTAKGGGGGGAYAGGAGGCGGSGGGGGGGSTGLPTTAGPANQSTQPGNSGAYGFGNDGAAGNTNGTGGGGAGGGAGGAGVGGGFGGGTGGGGKSYTIADGTTSVGYAGGGGGGQGSPGQQTQGAGQDGGGDGGVGPGDPGTRSAQSGSANRGGGGGGGEFDNGQGASGGKGIVIVRY